MSNLYADLAFLSTKALEDIAKIPLEDPRFLKGYGSSKHHHVYSGGLLVHTSEVWRYARVMGREMKATFDILLPSVIWHDYFKIRDYNDKGEKVDYANRIRHIAGSFGEFYRVAYGKLDSVLIDAIGHCLLSHHGFNPAWGSSVEPKSKEAYILHFADMLSMAHGPGRVAA